jgi:predicted secreted protein
LLAIAFGGNVVDARSSRSVKVGKAFALELEGNPSTGYRWRLNESKSTGLDAVRVEPMGYRSKPGGGKVVVGAPALFVFRITCVKAGSAQLFFDYVGPTGTLSDRMDEARVRCE